LGVGGGELAATVPGAGDEAGTDRRRLPAEAGRLDPGLGRVERSIGDAGEEEVLPHGEPDVAVAEFLRDRGERAHLLDGQLADRQDDADPVDPRLLLPVDANVALTVNRRTRLGERRVKLL